MSRQVSFARNPLATNEVAESIKITDKVRSVFDRGGSSHIHPQSTLKLEWLKPCPDQPRKMFDAAALEELKASIRAHGILEPLVVRLRDSHYEIVCGERRYRAARELKLAEVPVTVRELDDKEAYALSLHENIHRDNLSPMDEARAYRHLLKTGHASTQADVARFAGVTQARVSQKLSLLDMATEIQAKVASASKSSPGQLTERHARVIRRLDSPDKQKLLAERVINQMLSVSETESLVDKMAKPSRPAKPAASKDQWMKAGAARYRVTDNGLAVEIASGDRKQQIKALEALVRTLKARR